MNRYQLVGGAVVSGSFQAFDQGYLVHALQSLADNYFGVANIPLDMPQKKLLGLDQAGVCAVRFNLKRGGSAGIEHLEYLSCKLFNEFQWHTELYVDSRDLPDLLPILKKLPAYVIDHLGLSEAGLGHLYKCVELGARVKASGFGRLGFKPIPVMKQIMDINPQALMFGSDLPSTRAPVPFTENDLDLIKQNFSKSDSRKIYYENALTWYGRSKRKSH